MALTLALKPLPSAATAGPRSTACRSFSVRVGDSAPGALGATVSLSLHELMSTAAANQRAKPALRVVMSEADLHILPSWNGTALDCAPILAQAHQG
jgi:hypothetical protein